jgi:hypothetical protein
MRMIEARQVVEVAVLPERKLGVGRTRDEPSSLEDGDGPRAHALEETLAARGEHGCAG